MKRTMIVLMIAMLVLVGCSDSSPPDVSNTPSQGQESVGGSCGLEAPEKPNILGNLNIEIKESL